MVYLCEFLVLQLPQSSGMSENNQLSHSFELASKGMMTSILRLFYCTVVAWTLSIPLSSAQQKEGSSLNTNESQVPVLLGIPPKANLNLAGKNLQLSLSPTGESVTQRVTPREASIWINYSSVVEPNTSNAIFVSMGMNNVPAEIIIRLKVDPYEGNGSGQLGAPTVPIILSSYPQPIITDIGSCYTGVGEGQGHKLTYSWELAPNYDPELLRLDELQIAADIVYTIVND